MAKKAEQRKTMCVIYVMQLSIGLTLKNQGCYFLRALLCSTRFTLEKSLLDPLMNNKKSPQHHRSVASAIFSHIKFIFFLFQLGGVVLQTFNVPTENNTVVAYLQVFYHRLYTKSL